MTMARESSRRLGNIINSVATNKSNLFEEGIVIDASKKSDKVKVKLLSNKQTITARLLRELISEEIFIGGMPELGARVLLAKISSYDDPYSDCVIIGYLKDEGKNKFTEPQRTKNDPKSYFIKTRAGMFLFYKDNDGKFHTEIESSGSIEITANNGDIKIDSKNKNLIELANKISAISGNINLGEDNLGNDNTIVLSPHLSKYNDLINAITQWITLATPTLIVAGGLTGAIFPPTATPNFISASTQAVDTLNKTSKTKAK